MDKIGKTSVPTAMIRVWRRFVWDSFQSPLYSDGYNRITSQSYYLTGLLRFFRRQFLSAFFLE